jgi:hypothetical protein
MLTSVELGESLNFYPLYGLQIGRWLSVLHQEDQLFMYVPSPNLMVFIVVYPQADLTPIDFTRKSLHKNFGATSYFVAPRTKEQGLPRGMTSAIGCLASLLQSLQGNYWGVCAFELELKDITGFDYCNTLSMYGQRFTIEVNKIVKKWFPDVKHFCREYHIQQDALDSPYYTPTLNLDQTAFVTRQMYPKDRPKKESSYRDEQYYTEDNCLYAVRIKSTPVSPLKVSFCSNEDEDLLISPRDQVTLVTEADNEHEVHRTEFKHIMIQAYFDDPLLPFFMQSLVKREENKRILRLYEAGLPSWAVFLPSYGLYYRPWMRTVMTFLIFCVSLSTMLLGFYDLYKHIPLLRSTLFSVFGPLLEWFEEAIVLRLSFLLGYLLASSMFFQSIVQFCCWPILELMASLSYLLTPLQYLCSFITTVLYPFFSLIRFIVLVVVEVLNQIKNVVVMTVWLPADLTLFTYNSLLSLLSGVGYVFSSIISFIKAIVRTADTNRQVLETANSLSLLASVREFWQNIFRHVLKGITSIYHFSVYTACNIYKYKESMWLDLERYYRRNHVVIKRRAYQASGVLLAVAIAKLSVSDNF